MKTSQSYQSTTLQTATQMTSCSKIPLEHLRRNLSKTIKSKKSDKPPPPTYPRSYKTSIFESTNSKHLTPPPFPKRAFPPANSSTPSYCALGWGGPRQKRRNEKSLYGRLCRDPIFIHRWWHLMKKVRDNRRFCDLKVSELRTMRRRGHRGLWRILLWSISFSAIRDI